MAETASGAPEQELARGGIRAALFALRDSAGRLRIPSRSTLAGRWAHVAAGMRADLEQERAEGRPFLFVPVLIGCGAAIWFTASAVPSTTLLLWLLALLGGAATMIRISGRRTHPLLLAALLVVSGMLLADWQTRRQTTVMLDTPVTTMVSGTITGREAGPSGETRYVLAVTATADPVLRRPPSAVTMIARGRQPAFAIGSAISGRARLSPPSGPALPGLNDFAFGAYFAGIGAVGYFLGPPKEVTAPTDMSSSGRTDPSTLYQRFETRMTIMRTGVTDRIRSVIGGDAGAFAAAVVTGERRAMSEPTVQALRVSGLAHIISISGLHMVLAAGLLFVGLRSALSLSMIVTHRLPVKKIAATGALAASLFYLLLSDVQIPALRAFVMTAVMLVAVLLDRPAISLRNFALSALVVLVVAPSQILGPSFQMSFAATAALISGYAMFAGRERTDPFLPANLLPRWVTMPLTMLGGIILSSVIGGLSTTLFAIDHFHRVGAYGLPANLAAMPIVSFVVMPAGLVAMVLMPLGLDALPLKIMGYGLDAVIAVAVEIESWGGYGGIERLPAWFLPVMASGFVLLTLLSTRLRHIGTLLLALSIGCGLLPARTPAGPVLIAEDGRLVGIIGRDSDDLAVNSTRPGKFILTQWQEALRRPQLLKPVLIATVTPPVLPDTDRFAPLPAALLDQVEKAMDAMPEGAAPDRFTCVEHLWCLARLGDGTRIATVDDGRLVGPACARADIVVTPSRPRYAECRKGARLITTADMRISGSLEIDPKGPKQRRLDIRTSITGEVRPWQIHRRYDWRRDRYDMRPSDKVVARLAGRGYGRHAGRLDDDGGDHGRTSKTDAREAGRKR